MLKAPELLAPAGSPQKMRYAYAYGADAVYAGLPRYALRARNNEFGNEELAAGIEEAHAAGKKLYVTVNIFAHNAKLATFLDDLAPVAALRPDGFIMADPGLIMLVRERWPELPIHLSVQANTVNHAAVRFWRAAGVERVILSRELALDEIAEIRQACPDTELEVFVHGALCIAYSGRCLLSGYFNHRDANQGVCTNSCRWDYRVHRHPDAEQGYLLEEGERPGEFLPIDEDEHGTYIMNSRDLRALEQVAQLVEIGVDSLKIEGRTKSLYYVARATLAYRRAIDAAAAGKPLEPELFTVLDGLASRGYTPGFLDRHAPEHLQTYEHGESRLGNRHYVGDVVAVHDGMAEVEVKNRFAVGDRLELMTPGGLEEFTVASLSSMAGVAMEAAPGGGWRVRMPTPAQAEKGFGLLARCL